MSCFHCSGYIDTAEHTAECCAWSEDRDELHGILECDITLPSIVGAIADRREAWRAFQRFAEKVILTKEDAERQRQILAIGVDPRRADRDSMGDQSGSGG